MVKGIFRPLSIAGAVLLASSPVTAREWESFVSVGYNTHTAEFVFEDGSTVALSVDDSGYHLGVGIRSFYGKNKNHLFGFAIDIDEIAGDQVIGYRALDYQYLLTDNWRFGGFFGAASIDTGLPQNGFYFGLNTTWVNLFNVFDVVLEYREGDGLARDRFVDELGDPQGEPGFPDIFLDYSSFAVKLQYSF